jgi:transcriptional regulator with XRE-family HTH domain
MTELTFIGANLRKKRKELNIKVKDLMQYIGVSRTSINDIETKATFSKNFVTYLLYLKNKGVDINKLFEKDE